MKKKMFLWALAGALALGTVACGNSGSGSSASSKASSSNEAASKSSKSEEMKNMSDFTASGKVLNIGVQSSVISVPVVYAESKGYYKDLGLIEDALNYLQKHYNEKISIQNVADEIYVSSGYLSKRFRSEVGIGFAEYLQKMRLEQAHFLIRTTNMKISDIAIEVGINNFSYFSSLFLKTYGMSPLEVRKSRIK